MGTFAAGHFLDDRTGRPVVGQVLRVLDFTTDAPLTPVGGPVATGARGGYGRFTVPGVDTVTLVAQDGTTVDLVSVEAQLSGGTGGGTSGTVVRTSVATSSALPTVGNNAGDLRLALDTDRWWLWDGTTWVDAGPVGIPGGGGVTDHGGLTGLGDDDHLLYALADGSRGQFAPRPTGTPNGSKFLRDDNTWAAPPTGGGGGTVSTPGHIWADSTLTRAQAQTHLDALGALGGGTLHLAPGLHDWTSDSTTLTVPANVTLQGSGMTGWADGQLESPARGTVIRRSSTTSPGIVCGKIASVRDLMLRVHHTWTGTKPPGTAVGIKINGNGGFYQNVAVRFFGGSGWLVDSEDTGAGNTATLNVNNNVFVNCSSTYNGGWGWHFKGSDSNANELMHIEGVANFAGQVKFERSSRNMMYGGHFDSAGKASICMEVDGIGNYLEYPYIEASGSPVGGDHVHLQGTGGIWVKGRYGSGVLSPLTSAATLSSWMVTDAGGQVGGRDLYSYRGRQDSTGANVAYWREQVGVVDGSSHYQFRGIKTNGDGVDVWDVNTAMTRIQAGLPIRLANYGSTARPSGMAAGAMIWDSTNSRPLWFTGSAWVRSDGSPA